MVSKLYCELRKKTCSASLMTQLKTSLVKNSIKFNDLAVKMRPHRIAYLRLLGRPYTLLYVRRSVGRLTTRLLTALRKLSVTYIIAYFRRVCELD